MTVSRVVIHSVTTVAVQQVRPIKTTTNILFAEFFPGLQCFLFQALRLRTYGITNNFGFKPIRVIQLKMKLGA